MIKGAHVILYSSDADADRRFLVDLLDRPTVDAGGGWLIAQLPPAEVADWTGRGVEFEAPVSDQGWGRVTSFRLPGGGRVRLYEARHPLAFEL